jgi:hypothetical protein
MYEKRLFLRYFNQKIFYKKCYICVIIVPIESVEPFAKQFERCAFSNGFSYIAALKVIVLSYQN